MPIPADAMSSAASAGKPGGHRAYPAVGRTQHDIIAEPLCRGSVALSFISPPGGPA